jgi:hypothetical protein
LSYVVHNYPSKRQLKEDVAALATTPPNAPTRAQLERRLTIQPTAVVPGADPKEGEAFLEGPPLPKPHRWYAKVLVREGVVVKVLS